MFTSCGSTLCVQPRTFCRTVRRVTFTGKVKNIKFEAEGKPSLNEGHGEASSPDSQYVYTRNRVTYPWSGWSCRKRWWRTEHTSVEKGGDELWIAEKFQSNPEIAGSPRNSFRASLEIKSNGGRALNTLGGVKAYQRLSNSECRIDMLGSQTTRDKLGSQKGNSPDLQLRSQSVC